MTPVEIPGNSEGRGAAIAVKKGLSDSTRAHPEFPAQSIEGEKGK